MILDKETLKNIINMIKSPDEENRYLAFQSLESMDLKNNVGELALIYKFSKRPSIVWEHEAPHAFQLLKPFVKREDQDLGLTIGHCLSIITSKLSSHTTVELFMELFTEEMIHLIEAVGYPVEQYEIDLKLKEWADKKA